MATRDLLEGVAYGLVIVVVGGLFTPVGWFVTIYTLLGIRRLAEHYADAPE